MCGPQRERGSRGRVLCLALTTGPSPPSVAGYRDLRAVLPGGRGDGIQVEHGIHLDLSVESSREPAHRGVLPTVLLCHLAVLLGDTSFVVYV